MASCSSTSVIHVSRSPEITHLFQKGAFYTLFKTHIFSVAVKLKALALSIWAFKSIWNLETSRDLDKLYESILCFDFFYVVLAHFKTSSHLLQFFRILQHCLAVKLLKCVVDETSLDSTPSCGQEDNDWF